MLVALSGVFASGCGELGARAEFDRLVKENTALELQVRLVGEDGDERCRQLARRLQRERGRQEQREDEKESIEAALEEATVHLEAVRERVALLHEEAGRLTTSGER